MVVAGRSSEPVLEFERDVQEVFVAADTADQLQAGRAAVGGPSAGNNHGRLPIEAERGSEHAGPDRRVFTQPPCRPQGDGTHQSATGAIADLDGSQPTRRIHREIVAEHHPLRPARSPPHGSDAISKRW